MGFVSHIHAMRLTHTGEDGFMLYIPSEVRIQSSKCERSSRRFSVVRLVCVRSTDGTRKGLRNHQCWVRHSSVDGYNSIRTIHVRRSSYFAQRTLRIERMYAFWGQDIDKKTTPFDLNREFRVSFDVGPSSSCADRT